MAQKLVAEFQLFLLRSKPESLLTSMVEDTASNMPGILVTLLEIHNSVLYLLPSKKVTDVASSAKLIT